MKKLVIIPGGFHPFHPGHLALYNAAIEAFPSADVYIAATADTSNRPFPFEAKQKLARLAGVPEHRFVQVKSPFSPQEITQLYDPKTTQLIFARSDKDTNQKPQAGGVKRDGSEAYLQPYQRNGLQPMSQHGYMVYLPTVPFGPGMSSATEIRAKWPDMDDEEKVQLVNSLYPATAGNARLTNVVQRIFDKTLGVNEKSAVDEAVQRRSSEEMYTAIRDNLVDLGTFESWLDHGGYKVDETLVASIPQAVAVESPEHSDYVNES